MAIFIAGTTPSPEAECNATELRRAAREHAAGTGHRRLPGPGPGIVGLMPGEIHMQTDVMEPAAHRLAAAGMELQDGWEAGRGEIESGEAAIGGDRMAGAFRNLYIRDSQIIRAVASETPGRIRADGELGGECVKIYLDAEANATAGLADAIAEGRR
jgi:hypothetical protein